VSVFSNVPCGVEAKTAVEVKSTTSAIASIADADADEDRLEKVTERSVRELFIA
jgi:hypothetical protein